MHLRLSCSPYRRETGDARNAGRILTLLLGKSLNLGRSQLLALAGHTPAAMLDLGHDARLS